MNDVRLRKEKSDYSLHWVIHSMFNNPNVKYSFLKNKLDEYGIKWFYSISTLILEQGLTTNCHLRL